MNLFLELSAAVQTIPTRFIPVQGFIAFLHPQAKQNRGENLPGFQPIGRFSNLI